MQWGHPRKLPHTATEEQRNLFPNISLPSFRLSLVVAGNHISQKALQAPKRSSLPFPCIEGGGFSLKWKRKFGEYGVLQLLSSFSVPPSGFGSFLRIWHMHICQKGQICISSTVSRTGGEGKYACRGVKGEEVDGGIIEREASPSRVLEGASFFTHLSMFLATNLG